MPRWEWTTYKHLLVLGNTNALPLNNLHIVQSTQNLVLDAELRLHGELGSLLDAEGVVLEGLQSTGSGEVNADGIAARGVHGEREDDALARVAWVGEVLPAAAETEGLLVAPEGFVVGVWKIV